MHTPSMHASIESSARDASIAPICGECAADAQFSPRSACAARAAGARRRAGWLPESSRLEGKDSAPSLPRCLGPAPEVHAIDAAVRTAVLSQKVDQGRRPRRLRSTRRAGVGRESRRALCWHRPPVLYPRGATRAKLCKCCQGQTPQNFDRVLAAACLYRDMLRSHVVFRLCKSAAGAPARRYTVPVSASS